MVFPLIIVVRVLKPDSLNFKFEAFVIARVDVGPGRIFEWKISHLVDPALTTSHFLKCFLLERQHQARGIYFNVYFVISEVRLDTLRNRVNLTLQLVKLIFSLELGPFIQVLYFEKLRKTPYRYSLVNYLDREHFYFQFEIGFVYCFLG